jgi:hypothetical protein
MIELRRMDAESLCFETPKPSRFPLEVLRAHHIGVYGGPPVLPYESDAETLADDPRWPIPKEAGSIIPDESDAQTVRVVVARRAPPRREETAGR